MKILYVATIYGTIEAFLIPHIIMLLKAGHKVDIACDISRPIDPQLVENGCGAYNINFSRLPTSRANVVAYKKLKELIEEKEYDLVHTHTPVASFITRLACRKKENIKVVYTAHGFHFYKGAPLKSWVLYYPIEKLASRWTDVILTMNQEDYERATTKKLAKYSVKNVHGVGIDLNRFKPQDEEIKRQKRKEYAYKHSDFILFYAAVLNNRKNQELLIRAVDRLKDDIPSIKLLLAGSLKSSSSCKVLVEKLGLENQVEFLGYQKDIRDYLLLSDIAVGSSKMEGLPVNVMEAMATGLPLVVTDIRGHRDLVKDGENGFVIKLGDVTGFAQSIKRLYEEEELRSEFSIKAVERVKDFSVEKVLEEMDAIYSEITDYKKQLIS